MREGRGDRDGVLLVARLARRALCTPPRFPGLSQGSHTGCRARGDPDDARGSARARPGYLAKPDTFGTQGTPWSNRASDSPLGFSKWTMVLSSLKMLTCRGRGEGGPGVSGAGARTPQKLSRFPQCRVLSPHLLDAGDVRDAEALEGALQALVVHGRGLVRRLGLPADGTLATDAGLRRERGRAEKERARE